MEESDGPGPGPHHGKHCGDARAGHPAGCHQITIEEDRRQHGAGPRRIFIRTLPPGTCRVTFTDGYGNVPWRLLMSLGIACTGGLTRWVRPCRHDRTGFPLRQQGPLPRRAVRSAPHSVHQCRPGLQGGCHPLRGVGCRPPPQGGGRSRGGHADPGLSGGLRRADRRSCLADGARLRTLRCPAARPARPVDLTGLRAGHPQDGAASRGRHLRPGRMRRQGPDVHARQGPRGHGAVRGPAGQPQVHHRGRGRSRQRSSG